MIFGLKNPWHRGFAMCHGFPTLCIIKSWVRWSCTLFCVCQVPGYGDVKVSVESVPQSVVIGTTFTVLLKVINCSWVTFAILSYKSLVEFVIIFVMMCNMYWWIGSLWCWPVNIIDCRQITHVYLETFDRAKLIKQKVTALFDHVYLTCMKVVVSMSKDIENIINRQVNTLNCWFLDPGRSQNCYNGCCWGCCYPFEKCLRLS